MGWVILACAVAVGVSIAGRYASAKKSEAPAMTDDLHKELLDMCVSLQRELKADAVCVAASGQRFLASLDWDGQVSREQRAYAFPAGPRAVIVVIATGEPTFAVRPGGAAEPAIALVAAQHWLERTLDVFSAQSKKNADFVSPMTEAEKKALGLN
jgi:hypothetical protein